MYVCDITTLAIVGRKHYNQVCLCKRNRERATETEQKARNLKIHVRRKVLKCNIYST